MILLLLDTIPKLLFDEIDKQRHKISITTSSDIVAGFINLFVVVPQQNAHESMIILYNI